MRIEVTNWAKYNPRADVNHSSWFRLQNNFWVDPAISKLSNDGKMVWVMLLSLASQQGKGEIEVDEHVVKTFLKITDEQLKETIDSLQDSELIKIATVRRRNVNVTPRRYADVHIRTNGRNVRTDERTDVVTDRVSDDTPAEPGTALVLSSPQAKPPKAEPTTRAAREAYKAAYQNRYGHLPVQNPTTNGQMANLVKRLGGEAPEVIRFFLTHDSSWYVRQVHAIGCCLKDAEPLRTQWAADHRVTNADAKEADKGQSNAQVFARVSAKLEAEGFLK